MLTLVARVTLSGKEKLRLLSAVVGVVVLEMSIVTAVVVSFLSKE